MNNVKSYRTSFQKLTAFILPAVLLFVAGVNSSAVASSTNKLAVEKAPIVKEIAVNRADSAKVYRVVEQMPKIVGGLQAVYKKIEYPREALSQGIEGHVYITFIVDKQGNVLQPEVLRGIGGGCGQAAIEAIKEVEFKPGRQNGKPVKVKFSLPINFKIK